MSLLRPKLWIKKNYGEHFDSYKLKDHEKAVAKIIKISKNYVKVFFITVYYI